MVLVVLLEGTIIRGLSIAWVADQERYGPTCPARRDSTMWAGPSGFTMSVETILPNSPGGIF